MDNYGNGSLSEHCQFSFYAIMNSVSIEFQIRYEERQGILRDQYEEFDEGWRRV